MEFEVLCFLLLLRSLPLRIVRAN
ncbi:unnamed protein product, partial [Rotaria magnacalcarata]